MSEEEIIDECGRLRFRLERSIRYCKTIAANWATLALLVQMANLIGIGLAFAAIVGQGGAISAFAALSICLTSVASELILRPTKRIERQMEFVYEYRALLNKLPLSNGDAIEEEIVKINQDRHTIDDKGGKVIPCLSVRCHNEVCLAFGRQESMHRLNFIQATLGQFCRFVGFSEKEEPTRP